MKCSHTFLVRVQHTVEIFVKTEKDKHMVFKVNEAPKLALHKISEAEVKERLKGALFFGSAMSEYGKSSFNELKSQLKLLRLKDDATQDQIDLQVVNTLNLLGKFHNDLLGASDGYVLGRRIWHVEHLPKSYREAVSQVYDEIKLKYGMELNYRNVKK